VIKAFNLDEKFSFRTLDEYHESVDFFLFDSKTNLPGGSGQKFNWKMLQNYKGAVPFFLSGGITPGDADIIKQLDHPRLFGIDLNSGFEDEPGIKNSEKIKSFIETLKL